MKKYRLMLFNPAGKNKTVFQTFNKNEFKSEMVDNIFRGMLRYDQACNYIGLATSAELFMQDFDDGILACEGFTNNYYVDISEVNPIKDRHDYIMARLQEHYEEALSLGHEVFAIVIQGSQNYNLDVYAEEYQSDIDTKCIVLPSFEDVVKNNAGISTTHVRANNEHIDLKDIRNMFDTFRKQNVNFVEILFSDFYIVPDKYKKYWEELRAIAEDLTHCHPAQTVKTMSGLSMEKLKALKHPYPSIKDRIDKFGFDAKQAHHIIRINDFIKQYVSGKPFKDCLSPSTSELADYLKKVKVPGYIPRVEDIEDELIRLDAETKAIKDNFINKVGENIVSDEPYLKLGDIKFRVLKQFFKECILDDEN